MNYLALGDRLHPDTINLLLTAFDQASSEPAPAGPILVRKLGGFDEVPGTWAVLLQTPALPGYETAPLLRRLTKNGSEWRHFPMRTPIDRPIHELDRDGCPLRIDSLATLPTLFVESVMAAAAQLGLPLGRQIEQLLNCLIVCAQFPQLASLATLISSLEICLRQGYMQTADLCRVLYNAELLLALAKLNPGDRHQLPQPNLDRYPSTVVISQQVHSLYKAIGNANIEIGATDKVNSAFIKQIVQHFDPIESTLSRSVGQAAGSIIQELNWQGRLRVNLKPRPLFN